jgi:protein-S-isoprenylcysteine O-methyltransferase Ste14
MSSAAAETAQREGDHPAARTVTVWRHVRAIALLPFMNTVVIPATILLVAGRSGFAHHRTAAIALALGGATVAVGVALAGHSIRQLMRDGRGTLAPWDPTAMLVTSGAYRYIRNPMKAGLFLILLGEAVMLGSRPLLGWFAVFVAANAAYIRLSEEPGLRKRFGGAYERYCARVPRWVPRFPRARFGLEEGNG